MTRPNGLFLVLGCGLLVYSYLCFFKKKWALWFSVAPALEEKQGLTPMMLLLHGIITGVAGLYFLVKSIHLW